MIRSVTMPNRDTPPGLIEAWLDFHREGLCRNLDAVFAFDGQGMEIWCRSEDNGNLRKLQRIIDPLRNSHSVELYLTRPAKKNSGEDDKVTRTDIPPSLVENRELRSNLRFHAEQINKPIVITIVDADGQTYTQILPGVSGGASASNAAAINERVLRSRLTAWANSVLESNRIMRQYAADIPELLGVAFEPAFDAGLRGRAKDVCRKHAKDMVKNIVDLKKNLSRAFPKTPAKTAGNKKSAKEKSPAALSAVMEKADMLAAGARALSGRIYRFIYPDQYTVDLDELQRPGLLVSLDALEAEAGDFDQALATIHAS